MISRDFGSTPVYTDLNSTDNSVVIYSHIPVQSNSLSS